MLGFLICGGSCIIESGMRHDVNSILVRGGGHCLCRCGFNRRGLIAPGIIPVREGGLCLCSRDFQSPGSNWDIIIGIPLCGQSIPAVETAATQTKPACAG